MTAEQAMAYLAAHQGRLCCNYGNIEWPDGTTTNYSWQYAADNTCVTAAKTAMEAIERHAESGKNNQ